MCKVPTHHLKGLEFKSGCMMANKLNIHLPITAKLASKSDMSDEILEQYFCE
jgi:hypothetical protein